MNFITAHHLYELWRKAKGGEIDIFEFFQKIYSQQGRIIPVKKSNHSQPNSVQFPTQ